MKMKKMVGALALTAALAMGTAPAFAATADDNAFSDSGSTEVKAKVDTVNKQVRATVPLQVTVVFGATGGGEITGPTADAYKISNVGEGAIKLTNIEVTGMNSVFTSGVVTPTTSGPYTDENEDAITTGNHIMFTATTAQNSAFITTAHGAKDTKGGESYLFAGAKKWNDEQIAVGASLPITLGGYHYFTDTLASGEMSDTLCNLKCTIAAA